MRRGIVYLGALALLGCETITEELPARSTAVVPVPAPVIVTPVPAPTPTPGPTPTPNPNPAPSPTPRPSPSPTPAPGPTPTPPDNPDNTGPVVKIGAKVFFVECGGQVVPDSEHATSAQVGCRVHMDATAKDANNKPTEAKGTPRWTYSDPSLISVSGKNPWTPVLGVKKAGHLTVYVEVDGVRSNEVSIRFYN